MWYAPYETTVVTQDEYGNENGVHTIYGNPVKFKANVSPAKGTAVAQMFGLDDQYDRIIAIGERDTPIDEYAVLWIDTKPDLDADGALTVNADGEIVTPWDYIVRRVARGLPGFGSTVIAVSRVNVS
jgi:hypothetical protein